MPDINLCSLVQPLDSSAAMTNGSVDIGHSSAIQPHFDRKLGSCKLVDGMDVVLSCHVTGNPMPNVSYINEQ